MAEQGDSATGQTMPGLEEIQHWTWVMGRMQQMSMEHMAAVAKDQPTESFALADSAKWQQQMEDAFAKFPMPTAESQMAMWTDAVELWKGFFDQSTKFLQGKPITGEIPSCDRRFADPAWQSHPVYALIHQSYLMLSDHMLKAADSIEVEDKKSAGKLRFATRNMVDAMSPSNFALTNPQVLQKTLETRGDNLLKGWEHMLADMRKGQLTHTDPDAFEVGRNIASTPGKVIHETPLYQLIQYTPTTEKLLETPLVIFPPWINRFYILDLNEKKSFVRWALDQGISVFMVSWKSADASMAETVWDDYIASQVDAIDTVRETLGVPSVHAIGYCVAGTTLAATLAMLAKRGEADRVKSATFFTAQVDFEKAGDLQLFIDEDQLKLVDQLSGQGYLDGRYMALTFNLLRGRDLIWNYVVNNYLMGEDYPPFDLLHWNGDTTNLPTKWHKAYLTDLYRDNKLVQPNAMKVDGTSIDLRLIETPCYIQAGREDHIAPAESVWRFTHHLSAPTKFLLAGSGHIAGVVNPPAAEKYQYWTNSDAVDSLDEFIAGAKETKGSWWPDWVEWIRAHGKDTVKASKARVPGKGKKKAIEDAPGRYVKSR